MPKDNQKLKELITNTNEEIQKVANETAEKLNGLQNESQALANTINRIAGSIKAYQTDAGAMGLTEEEAQEKVEELGTQFRMNQFNLQEKQNEMKELENKANIDIRVLEGQRNTYQSFLTEEENEEESSNNEEK